MDNDIEKQAAEVVDEAQETTKAEQEVKTPSNQGQGVPPKKKKKKKKYKLHTMDIITIIFTVIIVGIMAFVLYNQFAGKNDGDPSKGTSPASTTPAPATATPKPTLSDIGNVYGNITNDANAVTVNKREYFTSTDSAGDMHIYVKAGDVTTDLIKANAKSLNVVTDYISYAGQSDVSAYYVFYINSDGKICSVYDGPLGGTGMEQKSNLEEKVFADGKYQSIIVSGEYLYYLNENGEIGKISIADKVDTKLSSEHTYKSFTVYYGVIYAIGQQDNLLYTLPSNPADTSASASPTASATPAASPTAEADTSKEKVLINSICKNFVIDNDWIYIINDSGIARYLLDGSGKDTLTAQKADAINVYKDTIFYITNGEIYKAAAEDLLLNKPVKIGTAYSGGINVGANAVYIKNNEGKLLKSTLDTKTSTYSEFTAMNE